MIHLSNILALVLALTAAVTIATSAVVAEETTTVALEPSDAATARGTLTIQAHGDAASIVIEMDGLEPGMDYVAALHAGSCEMPSASFGNLGVLTADQDGRAALQTEGVRMSAGGAPIDLTVPLIADGDHVVNVRAGHTIACARIPAMEGSGGRLHR
jgi:hypothetical protein